MNEQEQVQLIEKVMEAVMGSVEKFVKDEFDAIDKKYLVAPNMTPEQEKAQLELKDSERFVNLLKAMGKKDYGSLKAVSNEVYAERKVADPQLEGTDNVGGYLVPAVTEAKILRLIPTFAQARSEMKIIPMGKTDTLVIPKKLTGVTVSAVSEAGAITSSKATLATLTLLAKKWAGLTTLSSELIADANVAIANYILELFAEALGTWEDDQYFDGDGSPFTGVFDDSHTFGYSVEVGTAINTTNVTYAKLLGMVYGMDQKRYKGAKWYMHRTVVEVVRGILDDYGQPIFREANAGGLPTLLGYPVVMIENAPDADTTTAGKPFIILGNLQQSMIGDKAGLRVDYSSEAVVDDTSLFQNDLSAIRVIKRGGFNAGLTQAYAVAKITA